MRISLPVLQIPNHTTEPSGRSLDSLCVINRFSTSTDKVHPATSPFILVFPKFPPCVLSSPTKILLNFPARFSLRIFYLLTTWHSNCTIATLCLSGDKISRFSCIYNFPALQDYNFSLYCGLEVIRRQLGFQDRLILPFLR